MDGRSVVRGLQRMGRGSRVDPLLQWGAAVTMTWKRAHVAPGCASGKSNHFWSLDAGGEHRQNLAGLRRLEGPAAQHSCWGPFMRLCRIGYSTRCEALCFGYTRLRRCSRLAIGSRKLILGGSGYGIGLRGSAPHGQWGLRAAGVRSSLTRQVFGRDPWLPSPGQQHRSLHLARPSAWVAVGAESSPPHGQWGLRAGGCAVCCWSEV